MPLFLELGLNTRLPVPLSVIDEPVRELLELDSGISHYLRLLLLGRIRMSNVLWAHHPSLEILNSLGGKAHGFAGLGHDGEGSA